MFGSDVLGSNWISALTQALAISNYFPQEQEEQSLVSGLKSPHIFNNMTCPVDLPFSCTNETVIEDSCCFEYPGGVILLTQFWDYHPATGPKDEFTLHGLWPDNCDGSFEQFCNASLEIDNPSEIVSYYDEQLLKDMQYYWKDFQGNDEKFWIHEFNKHGTCYTTIKPECYAQDYSNRIDVYDFFKAAIDLHKKLPTYKFLADEGIVPSTTETYTKEQILNALRKNFNGFEPFVKCDRFNSINEIWYFHNLKGNLKNGQFNQIDTFNSFRCPSEGIKYVPKGESFTRPTKTLEPRPKPTDDGEIGYVVITNHSGCLIKNGKWYSSGTCANYKLHKLNSGKVLLKSNSGYCGIEDDKFVCSQRVKAYEFSIDQDTGFIYTDDSKIWSSDRIPYGRTQVDVKDIAGSVEFNLKFVKKW